MKYHLEKRLENIVIKNSNAIIAIDLYLKEHIIKEFNISSEKIFIAPNGVDTSFYRKLERNNKLIKKHKIPGNKFIIGFDFSKNSEGFSFILDNCNKIFSEIQNIHFLIFGNKIKHEKKENFTFLPNISREEMPEYYNLIDLFILPRLKLKMNEIITPLKILEIMSCEIPILVSNVGGLTSCIVNNETGYIFEEGNLRDLIRKIKYIKNDKKRHLIAKNSRKWVKENKNWKYTTSQYLRCYKYLNT